MKTSKYFKVATMVTAYGASIVIAYNTTKCFIECGLLNKCRVKKFIKKHNAKIADYRGRVYPDGCII